MKWMYIRYDVCIMEWEGFYLVRMRVQLEDG